MQKPRSGRQVYSKQALSKASQSQRTKRINQKTQLKKSVMTQSIDEIKDEDSMKEEEKDKDLQNEQNEKETKKERTVKPRIKLDEKILLYSDNGIKKYYEAIMSTTFKDSSSDERNLNKLVDLFKNWHFILFPRYDTELFTSRITALGKKSSVKAYMSRLRKIHKGEESWDVMYDEQNEILDKGKTIKSQTQKNDKANDNKDKVIANNNDKPPISIQLKPAKNEENNYEDLILDNIAGINNNKENEYSDDVNSKDFENINDINREEEFNIMAEHFNTIAHSEFSESSKKRTYQEAFGEQPMRLDNLIETKKPKLDN